MSDNAFPTLEELGRPSIFFDTFKAKKCGVFLIAGGHYSGRTTTIASFANELQSLGLSVLQLRLPNLESLPGLDSISSDSVDEALISYLLDEGKPDVLVLNDIDDPDLYLLSLILAAQGTVVIVGMYTRKPRFYTKSSAEYAIEHFWETLPSDRDISSDLKELVALSVHQKFKTLAGGNTLTQQDINHLKAVGTARNMFVEEASKQYFLRRGEGLSVLEYQTLAS